MMIAPLPDDEPKRLAALRSYAVLDTVYEPVFDAITRLAGTICNVPIALISLVDQDRQWFKSVQGLPGVTQTPRDLAFCAHAILRDELMEIPDAANDLRFHDNPLVAGDPRIRFYAGMPLVDQGGYGLGTLCVIDRQPRQLDSHQRAMLGELATVVMKLLESRRTELRAAQLGALLHQSIGHIYVADATSLRIEEASAGSLKATGYTETDIKKLRLSELLAGLPADEWLRDVAGTGRSPLDERMIEASCRRRDGSSFPLLLSLNAARGADGAAQALICVGLDTSERHRHEVMLRDLVREKETLLREVYHRVKNNLQVIVSLLSLQQRTLVEE
jgi:PAS domain S-box-containing protein